MTVNQGCVKEAEKLVGLVLVSVTTCEPGAVPPMNCEKETDDGVAEIALGATAIVTITGILSGAAPPVTMTLAVFRPVGNPVGSAVSVKVAGVLPVEGEMVSHD